MSRYFLATGFFHLTPFYQIPDASSTSYFLKLEQELLKIQFLSPEFTTYCSIRFCTPEGMSLVRYN
jgi:hypothetical protein